MSPRRHEVHEEKSPKEFIANRIQANTLIELPVSMIHTLALQNMPLRHNAPFDRLLVVQAMVNQVPLLSADQQLSAYDIERLWWPFTVTSRTGNSLARPTRKHPTLNQIHIQFTPYIGKCFIIGKLKKQQA